MAFNYKSPIQLVFEEMQLKLNHDIEQALVTATQEINVVVDKEELVKILTKDKARYQDAYLQGYNDALEQVEERIGGFLRAIKRGAIYEEEE